MTSWDLVSDGPFIIDAANDQYLVAPIILSSPGCHTGGGDLCAPEVAYSEDSGTTWKFAKPRLSIAHGSVLLVGDSMYYAGQRARLPELSNGDDAWKDYYYSASGKPQVRQQPIDSKPHCLLSPKED